ncbi:MAG: hypothetical protein DWQ04_07175 [Chloroflexi bacterium]|nr:MAG: hypothetical protein DWQ04_07175 [Chloroflexota bacterium]
MQTLQHKLIRWQQLILIAAITLIMIIVMLFSLNQSTNALRIASGAGGCGNFDDAVATAQEGKTIIQMIPAKPSNGVIITKDLTIQGGWSPSSGCNEANEQAIGAQSFIISGFTFLAPESRSLLNHAGTESVITIDPQVEALLIEHMIFEHTSGSDENGGGISGTLNISGAAMRLNNVVISDSESLKNGGGLYMSLQNGSRLEILDSHFDNNTAKNGGAFEIQVDGNSHLIMNNTKVTNNSATSGNGGGGRIIISSGWVTITNGTFSGNSASGSGKGLSIEKVGSDPATVTLINTSTDGLIHQPDENLILNTLDQTGSNLTLNILNEQVFLPLVITPSDPSALTSEITGITINNDYNYEVTFNVTNFTPDTNGNHVHFFFNTVPASIAGTQAPGGTWIPYDGSSPFTGYSPTNKPVLATHMCILVANGVHAVTQGTGNCYPLPQ